MTEQRMTEQRLEDELMRYGEDIERGAAGRRERSWARLRATLREAPQAGRPWWRIGLVLAPVAAAAVVAFAFLRPVEATVVAGRGEAIAIVDGREVALRIGDGVPAGSTIRTAPDGWVALEIEGDRISVDTGSRIVVRELSRLPRRVVIEQLEGRTWNVLAKEAGRDYVLRTASGDVVAKGTAFLVTTPPDAPAEVAMAEGVVEVNAPAGSATVQSGQRARLTAAPPAVEPLPTQTLTTETAATLVDALGRSCAAGGSDVPGCLATANKAFTLLAGIGKELSLEFRANAAGNAPVTAGETKKEIAIPGQGTFRVKVSLSESGTTLKIDVKERARRVVTSREGSEEAKREAEKAAEEAQREAEQAAAKTKSAADRASAKATEAAEKAAKAAGSGSDADRKEAERAAEDAKRAADEARELAEDAKEDADEATEKAAKSTSKAAEQAADKARKAAEKAKEESAKAAEKAKEAAEKAARKDDKSKDDAAKDAAKQAREQCEQATDKAKDEAKQRAEAQKEEAKRAAERAKEQAKATEQSAKDACDKAADKDACKKAAEDARAAAERAAEKAREDAEKAAEAAKEKAEADAKQAKAGCERKAKEAEAAASPTPRPSPATSPSPRPSPTPTQRP